MRETSFETLLKKLLRADTTISEAGESLKEKSIPVFFLLEGSNSRQNQEYFALSNLTDQYKTSKKTDGLEPLRVVSCNSESLKLFFGNANIKYWTLLLKYG